MVTIIDYGIGNLRSIEKAFEFVGEKVERTDDLVKIARASHLVLPGVGAFGACIKEVRDRGLETQRKRAVEKGTPLLGVCVGMQMLFESSTERGSHRGLHLVPGRIDAFRLDDPVLKVPHMGWNTLISHLSSPLLEGLGDEPRCYFVHSYRAEAVQESDILASTDYGGSFPAVVGRENVYGVQFHPEKSQHVGLRILKNFASLG